MKNRVAFGVFLAVVVCFVVVTIQQLTKPGDLGKATSCKFVTILAGKDAAKPAPAAQQKQAQATRENKPKAEAKVACQARGEAKAAAKEKPEAKLQKKHKAPAPKQAVAQMDKDEVIARLDKDLAVRSRALDEAQGGIAARNAQIVKLRDAVRDLAMENKALKEMRDELLTQVARLEKDMKMQQQMPVVENAPVEALVEMDEGCGCGQRAAPEAPSAGSTVMPLSGYDGVPTGEAPEPVDEAKSPLKLVDPWADAP